MTLTRRRTILHQQQYSRDVHKASGRGTEKLALFRVAQDGKGIDGLPYGHLHMLVLGTAGIGIPQELLPMDCGRKYRLLDPAPQSIGGGRK